YLIGAGRQIIEAGPYVEAFRARGPEVIYFFEPIDEYVAAALAETGGKRLVSADRDDIDLGDAPPVEGESLTDEETAALCEWLKKSLGDTVEDVRSGKRLVTSPAVALNREGQMTPQLRAMLKAMNQDASVQKAILEINPRHSLIRKLSARTRADADDAIAALVAAQIRDNALLSAGLLESPESS